MAINACGEDRAGLLLVPMQGTEAGSVAQPWGLLGEFSSSYMDVKLGTLLGQGMDPVDPEFLPAPSSL